MGDSALFASCASLPSVHTASEQAVGNAAGHGVLNAVETSDTQQQQQRQKRKPLQKQKQGQQQQQDTQERRTPTPRPKKPASPVPRLPGFSTPRSTASSSLMPNVSPSTTRPAPSATPSSLYAGKRGTSADPVAPESRRGPESTSDAQNVLLRSLSSSAVPAIATRRSSSLRDSYSRSESASSKVLRTQNKVASSNNVVNSEEAQDYGVQMAQVLDLGQQQQQQPQKKETHADSDTQKNSDGSISLNKEEKVGNERHVNVVEPPEAQGARDRAAALYSMAAWSSSSSSMHSSEMSSVTEMEIQGYFGACEIEVQQKDDDAYDGKEKEEQQQICEALLNDDARLMPDGQEPQYTDQEKVHPHCYKEAQPRQDQQEWSEQGTHEEKTGEGKPEVTTLLQDARGLLVGGAPTNGANGRNASDGVTSTIVITNTAKRRGRRSTTSSISSSISSSRCSSMSPDVLGDARSDGVETDNKNNGSDKRLVVA
ncbi:hypothetical protein DQ04_10451020 [Trypanosoma grayi]|uniref:hypothetical protein n=1 Tax=Trypanosoma grayi TaxID=71804 RepID=UPI0004F43E25|nr:hypothetical protein DQ04_10451020 [Trypanosoma grayi]KEG07242.1 hypothetical protein DQ04_10451020 [Trypanosoma grayi]